MLAAPAWYLANDADPAGDTAASGWPARAIRVRPPDPHKDWTDTDKAGIDLSRWWTYRLNAVDAANPPPLNGSRTGVVEPLVKPPSGTEAPAPLAPWPPRPAELADWPVEWRERWGRLANELEDQGMPFPQHEIEAFRRVKTEIGP
jgi:hypothetical protein